MTFKETLNRAKEQNINPIDLEIAYELDCMLEHEIDDETFEEACSLIYDTWCKYEDVSVWCLAKAIIDLDFKIDDLSRRDLADRASWYC